MTFSGINYLAVVVAAIAAFVFGGIYYRVFGEAWMKALGISKKTASKNMSSTPLIITFIAELIMAWVLAGLMGHLGAGQVTAMNGVVSGAFVWLGFVVTTLVVNNAFAMRKPQLSVIDSAHWLVALAIMGAIIGAFGI
ncbi:MAG TPA: DUF1761 domain-containing protein [Xanthobacteraceae bacterium]|nr:DUF1761 domain-containing protein [Xanthobacteraceae bacterium]